MSKLHKVVLACVSALGLCASAEGATLVASCTASAAGNPATCACTLTGVGAGNTIAYAVRERDGGAPATVASDLSGSLASAVARGAGVGDYVAIWYVANATAGDNVVTGTWSAGAIGACYVYALGGVKTSGVLDQTANNANASGTAHVTSSITTTGAGAVLAAYAFSGDPTSVTDNTGAVYTVAYTLDKVATSRVLSIASGSTSSAVTTGASTSSNAVIANFLDAAAGTTCTGQFSLLGVGNCDGVGSQR